MRSILQSRPVPAGSKDPFEECAEQGQRVVGPPRDIAQVLAAATPVDDAGDTGHSHLARKPDQIGGMHRDRIAVEHLEREPGHLLVVLLGIERGDPSLERVPS
jgi:hypothetical protein